MNRNGSNSLCLECGLCCNGVIFADVRLEPGDEANRLQSLGLPLPPDRKPQIANRKFSQPCPVFDGCRCRIYADRPGYCREFECLLLKSVQAGRIEASAARRIVRAALQRAEKVKRPLRELGDADEQVALSIRFRRMKERFEPDIADEETTEVFSQLTLAVYDLNVLLSDAFCPGNSGGDGVPE
jgi:Fe-S-cluster containining protein